MQNQKDSQLEVDVLYLVKKLWLNKFKIIFTSLVFGLMAMLVSIFLLTPEYESSTKIYVVSKKDSDQEISTQELQAGSYLVNDYKEIILSSSVLSGVIEKEGLSLTATELKKKVAVTIPTDTRVITISVMDEDPQVASDLANSLRQVASDKIKEVMDVKDVNAFEEAEPANQPSSPNLKKNAALGILFGGFVAVAGLLIKEVLDDRVRRAEDVEEVLQMTLLGLIPDVNKLK